MDKHIRVIIKYAAITSAIIVIYELCFQLLLYRFIKFDYFIATAVIIALVTGILISKKTYPRKIDGQLHDPVILLTGKECQILLLIAEGKTNKEIAALNFVEISTVKTHINNIYGKMGVKNRMEASLVYRNHLFSQKSTFSPPSFS